MNTKTFIRTPLAAFHWLRNLFSRWSRYAITFAGINMSIWSVATICIIILPYQYISKSTLILPGAGVGAKMDIHNIGSASAIVNSPFSNNSLNPKVSYKSIAQSSKVLKDAASRLNMNVEEFGKPNIKLVDQTSLMYFHIADQDPAQAQQKSWALHHALQAQIQKLRLDEIKRREQGIQLMLKSANDKLNVAQKKLLSYQSQSNIATIEQYERIPIVIEEMRAQHAGLIIEKEQTLKELLTLSRILGLTSAQASQIMSLQADPFFQELVEQHSNANVLLTSHNSKWGQNHHKVKQQSLEIASAEKAMQDRAIQLIGTSQMVTQVSLADHNKRSDLFYDLITKKTQYEGIKQKTEHLEKQITLYQTRLRAQSTSVSKLDELEREHQIAEAVFTSAMAKIDTGKSDIFASYPMMQIMMEPTLPSKRSGAQPLHVIVGGVFGSLLSIVILTLLWFRRKNIETQPDATT